MGYDTIHETAIQDIVDTIKYGANELKKVSGPSGVAYSGSLTKATKGLIMEFPVLISKANHIESAGIVAKAYEAKFVTLLQLAFAAINVTHFSDATEFVKQFHTNLDAKMNVDDFIEVMDATAKVQLNSGMITAESYNMYKAVSEDMKNLSYYFDDDINESSLDSYKIMKNYSGLKVVKEDFKTPLDNANKMADELERSNRNATINRMNQSQANKDAQDNANKMADELERSNRNATINRQKETELNNRENERLTRDQRDNAKLAMDTIKINQELLTSNLVSSDVKKANELVPTMMVINFIKVVDGIPTQTSAIIGVKAKLYEVEPVDVINKLITKHVDNNVLLKLVKVSTREISFVRDFLLAIDDAKIDALSKSRRGSTNKLFKVLERRAIGGRIRKSLKLKDYTKAISSLVISQEEVEELLKNNIDVSNPKVIRPIMEKLNLISFAIIDESSESVKFLFDTGDDVYETIPLSKLEREQKDGMSKKVINLMAKMNR